MNHRNVPLILYLSQCVCLVTLGSLSSCAGAPEGQQNLLPKSVRAFLDTHDWGFSNLQRSDMTHLEDYNKQLRYYTVQDDIETVWNEYVTLDPREIWNSPPAQYGIMYSPDTNQSYQHNHPSPIVFHEGQIYVLELRIGYWLNIPVAFQITKIDPQNHVLEFNYLNQNKSNGQQEISFEGYTSPDGLSHTLITHLSYYTSHSKFRDQVLYPDFHVESIDAYHRSVATVSGFNTKVIRKAKVVLVTSGAQK